ncbi:MAG: ABC transporter permease [Candidatus Muirbacterium halophilum]|nr:ABC transporter permease [Candidatus Muirbacterium halophilum]
MSIFFKSIVSMFEYLGGIYIFLLNNIRALFNERFYYKVLFLEIYSIGVKSFGVVTLAGIFTGMVFVIQVGFNFMKMGAQSYIGGVVALAILRELSPVLVSIIVAGRAGSAMAAEIGTMKITEQIDALKMLSVDPYAYISLPKILASIIMLPILVIYSDFVGLAGGAFVAVSQVGISLVSYKNSIIVWVENYDIGSGLFKAIIFGFVISLVCCFNGFRTTKGAKGVGESATFSVVISIISILVLDYFLTVFLKYFYFLVYEM